MKIAVVFCLESMYFFNGMLYLLGLLLCHMVFCLFRVRTTVVWKVSIMVFTRLEHLRRVPSIWFNVDLMWWNIDTLCVDLKMNFVVC